MDVNIFVATVYSNFHLHGTFVNLPLSYDHLLQKQSVKVCLCNILNMDSVERALAVFKP